MNGIVISPEGTVTKDGKELGIIKDGVLYHSENIPGVVKGQIRDALKNEELKFSPVLKANPAFIEGAPMKLEVGIGEKAAPVALSDEELMELVKARGLMPPPLMAVNPDGGISLLEEPAKSSGTPVMEAFLKQKGKPGDEGFLPIRLIANQYLQERIDKGEIPAPPATRASLGQLDPVYVDWARQHATEEEFGLIYPNQEFVTEEQHAANVLAHDAQKKVGQGKPVEIKI